MDCACTRTRLHAHEQRLRAQLHAIRLRRVDRGFLRQTLREFKLVLQAQKTGGRIGTLRSNLAADAAECLGVYHVELARGENKCAKHFFIARLILWFNLRVQRMRPDLNPETADLTQFIRQK